MNEQVKKIQDRLLIWMDHSIRGQGKGNPVYFQGKIALITDMLDFIDRLPKLPENLDREILRYLDNLGVVPGGGLVEGLDDADLIKMARHFAEWGAEHVKKDGTDL